MAAPHAVPITGGKRGSSEESPLSKSANAAMLWPLARLQTEDLADSDFSSMESPDDASSVSTPLSPAPPVRSRPLSASSASPMRSRTTSPRPSRGEGGARDGRVSPGVSRRRLSGSLVHNRKLTGSPIRRRDSGVVDSDDARVDSPDDYEIRQKRRSALSCGFLGASMPNLASASMGITNLNQRHLRPPGSASSAESKRERMARRRSLVNMSMPASVATLSPLRRESPHGSQDDLLASGRASATAEAAEAASFPKDPTHTEMKELEWQLHSLQWRQRGRTPTRRGSVFSSERERARSLSPVSHTMPFDFCDEEPSFSDVFKERFEKVTKQLERKLNSFLAKLMQDQDENEKVENGMLLDLVDQLMQDSHDALLTTEIFRQVTEKLVKLSKQNIEEESTSRINELMLIISHPARIIECLEFNPETAARSEESQQIGKRLQDLQSDNLHLPRYIMDKVTTHLGPNGGLDLAFDSQIADAMANKMPQMQFLDYYADGTGESPTKGDFDIQKLLSSGAYGSVYLGRHKRSRELVAIKHLRKKDMLIKNCHEQVLAETKVLKFGRNPFVLTFFCSFTSNQSLYIVMEYAAGGDLATLLKNMGYLDERVARRYFAESVLAVEYIHEYGIIHRDLKPDNLVITKGGHIKLIDFGLSKFGALARTTLMMQDNASHSGRSRSSSAASRSDMHPTARTAEAGAAPHIAPSQSAQKDALHAELRRREQGVVARSVSGQAPARAADRAESGAADSFVGTPGYIAPEVILGDLHGKHVDWWGMGVILFELVTGDCPFPGDTAEEIFHHAVHSEVNWEVVAELGLSVELRDLVNQLLIKRPEHRLGSASRLDADLAAYGAGGTCVDQIKYHPFFDRSFDDDEGGEEAEIDWDELLEEKACFVPQLDDDLDTSYFDTREDRYDPNRISSDSDTSDDDMSSIGSEHSLSIFRNFSCVNLASSLNLSGSGQSLMQRAKNQEHPTSISMPASPFQEHDLERPLDFTPALGPSSLRRSLESASSVSLGKEDDSDLNISDLEHVASSTPSKGARPSPHAEHAEPNSAASPPTRLSLDDAPPSRRSLESPSNAIPMPVRSTPPVPSPLRAAGPQTPSSSGARRPRRRPGPLPLCMSGCVACDIVRLEWDAEVGFGFSFQTELGRREAGRGGKHSNVHRINHVLADSPAGRAGLKVDSTIIQVNHVDTASLNRRDLGKLIQDARAGPASFHCCIKPGKTAQSRSSTATTLLERMSRALGGKQQGDKGAPAPKKKKKKKRRKFKKQWDWLSRFTRSPAASPLPPDPADSDSPRGSFQLPDPSEAPPSPSRLKSWQTLLRRKSASAFSRSGLKSPLSLRRKASINSQESSSSCGNTLSSSPTSRSMGLPSYHPPPPANNTVLSPAIAANSVAVKAGKASRARPSSWHLSGRGASPVRHNLAISVSPTQIASMPTPCINVTPSTPSPKLRRHSIGERSPDGVADSPEAASRTAASSPLWSSSVDNSPCQSLYASPVPPVLPGDEGLHHATDVASQITIDYTDGTNETEA